MALSTYASFAGSKSSKRFAASRLVVDTTVLIRFFRCGALEALDRLRKERTGARDLGEAPSIAFCVAQREGGEVVAFATDDKGAARRAQGERIPTLDFLDVLAWLVALGLPVEQANAIAARAAKGRRVDPTAPFRGQPPGREQGAHERRDPPRPKETRKIRGPFEEHYDVDMSPDLKTRVADSVVVERAVTKRSS